MVIGSRIVVTVGSNQVLDIVASSGQAGQPSGTGQINLVEGNGLMLPFGMVAGVDMSWNHATTITLPPARKGFRETKVKKRPLSQYMIVFDCINDENILMKAVNSQAKSMTKGNKDQADKVSSQLSSALNLSAVDQIAERASAGPPSQSEVASMD